MEKTAVMLKPDALERKLHWQLLKEIELHCGLNLLALKLDHLNRADVRWLYGHQEHQPFFEDMAAYLTRGPVIFAVFEGVDTINRVRSFVGHYDKKAREVRRTLRSAYKEMAAPNYVNLIHASDCQEEATKIIRTIFGAAV